MNRFVAGKKYHSNTRANNQKSVISKKQSACCSKIKQRKENQAHSLKKVLLSRLNDNDLANQHKAREKVERIKIQFNFNLKTSLDINLPLTMTINEFRQLSLSFLKIHKKSCCESNYTYCGLYVENPLKILLKNIQIQDLKNVQSLKSQDKDQYSTNQLQSNHQGCQQLTKKSNDFRCQMKQILSKLGQILSQFIWQSIILSSKQRKDISSPELTLKQLRFQDTFLDIQQKEDQHQLTRKQVSPSLNYLFSHPPKNHDFLKVFAKYQAPFPKEKISAKEKNALTQSTKKNNYLRIPDINPVKESILKPYQNEKKKYFSISEYMDDSFKNSKCIFSRQVKKKYTSRIIKQLLSNELYHDYLNQVNGGQSYQNSRNQIEQENILKLNQSFHLNRKRLENGQDMQKDIYQMEQNSDTPKNPNQQSPFNFENQGNENIYIKQHTESSLSKSQSNKELTSDQQVQSPTKYDEHITFQPAQSYSVNDLDKCYEYLQNLLKKCQVVEWTATLNMLNRNCSNQKYTAQDLNQKTIDWSFCSIPIRIQNKPEIYNLCILDLKTTNDKSIRNFSRSIQQLFTTHHCILDCNLLQLYSFTEINKNKKTQQSKRIFQKVNAHKDSHDSRKIKCGKFLIKLSNKINTNLSLISYISQVLRIKCSDQFMQKEFQSINHQIVILLRQLLNSNIFQTLMKKKSLQRNTSKLNSQKIKNYENLWKFFLLNQDNNLKNKYQYEKYPLLSLFCVDLDNFDSCHGTLYLDAQEIMKRLKMIFQNLMTDQQKQNLCFNSKQNFNFMNKPDELNELTHKKQAKEHHNGQNLLEVMMQEVKREFQQINTIIWSKKHQMRYHKKLIPLNHLFKAHLIETSNHFIAQCSKTIQINNTLNAKQSLDSKSDKIQVNSLQKLLKFMLSQFQKSKQIYQRKITEARNLVFCTFPTNSFQLLDFYLAQDTREFRAEQDLNIYEKQTTYKKKKLSSKSYWNNRSGRNSLNLLEDIHTSSFHEYDSLLNLSKKQKVPYQTTKSQQKNKKRRNESKCLKVQNLIKINQKSIPKKKQHN